MCSLPVGTFYSGSQNNTPLRKRYWIRSPKTRGGKGTRLSLASNAFSRFAASAAGNGRRPAFSKSPCRIAARVNRNVFMRTAINSNVALGARNRSKLADCAGTGSLVGSKCFNGDSVCQGAWDALALCCYFVCFRATRRDPHRI